MIHLVSHVLAVYAIVGAPWLSCVTYQRAKKRFLAGDPQAKVRLYREWVVEQAVTTALVLGLWRFGGLSGPSLGITAPYSWLWNTAALVVLTALLVWTAVRLRPKASKIRKRFQDSLGMLFPDSPQERNWFGALSIGAGISEELVFRGFLMYYLSAYIPNINTGEKVLLTSLIFGVAHIYQGWRRSIPTGIVGIVLALLYVFSGSLILPVVVHAVADWRMLMILPPEATPAAPVESAA